MDIKNILNGALDEATDFEPAAFHSSEGDCIEVLMESVDFFARRLSSCLTVYLAESDRRPVGLLIKGVKRLLDDCPGFMIEIHEGNVCVEHVVSLAMWRSENSEELDVVSSIRESVRSRGMFVPVEA